MKHTKHTSEQDWYDDRRSTAPAWAFRFWWALPALVAAGLLAAAVG